ncbi:MAG: mono/diheme cytochrome c family protein, partial [Kiritimatiellia bacterium]
PVRNFTNMSDADLVAVVSYLDRLPPVDRTSAKTVFQPMGRLLWYFGVFDLQFTSSVDLSAPRPTTTPIDPLEHGKYLAKMSGCLDCHGAKGSGGPMPGAPADMAQPANITPHKTGLMGWTRDDFSNATRGGRSKDGRALDKGMPFKTLAGLSDTEVDDLWTYVQTLEPLEFGNH